MSIDNPIPDDLIMLDWDLILVQNIQPAEVPAEPNQIDQHRVDELLRRPWYRVEHPTRGVWLAISWSDVPPMAEMPDGQTFEEWDINLSICQITRIPDSLKRFDDGVDNGFDVYAEAPHEF